MELEKKALDPNKIINEAVTALGLNAKGAARLMKITPATFYMKRNSEKDSFNMNNLAVFSESLYKFSLELKEKIYKDSSK